jgi:hypothetical protein
MRCLDAARWAAFVTMRSIELGCRWPPALRDENTGASRLACWRKRGSSREIAFGSRTTCVFVPCEDGHLAMVGARLQIAQVGLTISDTRRPAMYRSRRTGALAYVAIGRAARAPPGADP